MKKYKHELMTIKFNNENFIAIDKIEELCEEYGLSYSYVVIRDENQR